MVAVSEKFEGAMALWRQADLGRMLVAATLGNGFLRLVGIVATFLVGVQLARYLGPEGYGIYGFVLSVVALLTIPAQAGLPQLITREVSSAFARDDHERLAGILKWSIRAVAGLSLCVLVLSFSALFLVGDKGNADYFDTYLLGFLLIPPMALTSLAGGGLRGFNRVVSADLSEVLLRPALFSLMLFGAATFFIVSPGMAMGLHACAAFASLIIAVLLFRSAVPPSVLLAKPLFLSGSWTRSAAPMTLTELLRVVDGHLAILVLGILASTEAVGHYRVAVSVAGFVVLPISILNLIAAPVIAKLFAVSDLQKLQFVATGVAFAMCAGAVILSLPFVLYGDWLLVTVFGEGFRPALSVLLLLLVGVFINGFFGVCATFLNMTGHERRVALALLISLPVSIAMMFILIPFAGIEGAAIAYLCGLAVWNVRMWRDARKLAGIDTSLLSVITVISKRRDT